MIEDKNNGLGDMIIPDKFWTKKSTHVVFRRPLEVEGDDTMNLKIGGKYRFYLQWGLFDNSTDEDPTKLKGNIYMDDFEPLTIVPISNVKRLGASIFVPACLSLILLQIVSLYS